MSHPCCGRIAFVIRKLKLIYSLPICSAGMWHEDLLEENWSIGKHLEKKETKDAPHMAAGVWQKYTANKMFMLS